MGHRDLWRGGATIRRAGVRMRWTLPRRTVAAAALLTLLLATSSPVPAGIGPVRVFVVVLDGFQPEDVTPTLTPTLWALREGGEARVYTNALSNMMSETNPNHTAMMTGTYGDTHGIFANEFIDPTTGEEADLDFPGLLLAPTLFDAIESENPSLRTSAVLGKEKLKKLFDCTRLPSDECGPTSTNPEGILVEHVRPDVLRGSSTTFEPNEPPGEPLSGSGVTLDNLVMNVVIEEIRERDPHFMFVNLPDVDGFQHLFTSRSVPGRAGVRNADLNVGRMVNELRRSGKWESSVLIVLSDHSFHESGDQVTTDAAGVEVGIGNHVTPLITGTAIVLSELFANTCTGPSSTANRDWVTFGGSASVYITDPGYDPYAGTPLTSSQAACLKELRDRALAREGIGEALYRVPVEGVTGLLDLEQPHWRLDTPRAGELILTAENTYAILPSPTSSDLASPGTHGGPPARPIAFIVASGGAFLVPSFDATMVGPIDVAPTVAALLGVNPPAASEGRVLEEAFPDLLP